MTAFLLATAGLVARGGWWWVDSLGTGDGTQSNTPMSSIQGAVDAASPDDTINICGAAGRTYTNVLFYDVAKSNLTLQDWQGKPTISLDTNNFPGIAVTNGAFFVIRASNVAVRNIRFQIDRNKFRQGASIIRVTNNMANVVLDGCEGRLLNGFNGIAYNAGSIIELKENTTNCTVQNCLLSDWDYDNQGWRLAALSVAGNGHQLVGNTFSNVDRAIQASGSALPNNNVTIRSNLFLNCLTQGGGGQPNQSLGIISAVYKQFSNCEISYNIAWNNNGKQPVFLQKTRTGFNGAGTRIFNNTIFNLLRFVDSFDVPANEGWMPQIVNNMMLQSLTTNFFSQDLDTTATNTYQAGSFIGYNLWSGGATNLTDPRIVLATITNNHNVAVPIANTNNPFSVGFLRPDANRTPEVLEGYGTVSNTYPVYIGAVVPVALRPCGTVMGVR